jgi:hypothetical protein
VAKLHQERDCFTSAAEPVPVPLKSFGLKTVL